VFACGFDFIDIHFSCEERVKKIESLKGEKRYTQTSKHQSEQQHVVNAWESYDCCVNLK
jgi:hypothetical protein